MTESEPEEPPKAPDSYLLLKRIRIWGPTLQFWDGGYSAQPHILMMEFEACVAGEAAHQGRKAFNQRQRAKGNENKPILQ